MWNSDRRVIGKKVKVQCCLSFCRRSLYGRSQWRASGRASVMSTKVKVKLQIKDPHLVRTKFCSLLNLCIFPPPSKLTDNSLGVSKLAKLRFGHGVEDL